MPRQAVARIRLRVSPWQLALPPRGPPAPRGRTALLAAASGVKEMLIPARNRAPVPFCPKETSICCVLLHAELIDGHVTEMLSTLCRHSFACEAPPGSVDSPSGAAPAMLPCTRSFSDGDRPPDSGSAKKDIATQPLLVILRVGTSRTARPPAESRVRVVVSGHKPGTSLRAANTNEEYEPVEAALSIGGFAAL